NVLIGNAISGPIGVSMRYAFVGYPQLEWIAGALAVSISIVLMQITKTLHPPAGATASIAVADWRVWPLGYGYLLTVVLGFSTIIIVALIVMNIQLRFPKYWI